jgi:hypothetical protein
MQRPDEGCREVLILVSSLVHLCLNHWLKQALSQ